MNKLIEFYSPRNCLTRLKDRSKCWELVGDSNFGDGALKDCPCNDFCPILGHRDLEDEMYQDWKRQVEKQADIEDE